MKPKKKVLKSEIVKSFVNDRYKPFAFKVIRATPITKPKSEYDIADDTNVKINKLRSLLYAFYSDNLVYYNRHRDPVKGWFIYNWQFHLEKLLELILKEKQKELKTLRVQKDSLEDGQQMYACESCETRLNFEEAFNEGFICSNCKSSLTSFEPKKDIKKLSKEIKKVEKEEKEIKDLLK